ncbi:MAG: phage tail assembly chaperone [Alphaproteobacteria bacterium]
MPWRRFMEIGLGILQLPPSDFWGMSLSEFYAACDGLREFNGGTEQEPLSRSELQELMELYPD